MSATKAAGAIYKILIVEDDRDTRELLDEQLEDEGYELTFTTNGEEAILRTGASEPDLIVMDVMMPRLNGLETTRFFKARFKGRFIPIMILSAKGDPSSIHEGAEIGADEYTTKPYSAESLRGRIRSLLELKRAEDDFSAGSAAPADPATNALGEIRLSMAQDFRSRGMLSFARSYLNRILEIMPGHGPSTELLSEISSRD